jgi:thiol-disulfide isomerase/thioredoxin
MEAGQGAAATHVSVQPLRLRSPLPSLDGVADWANGGQPSAEELAGHPVLIHFWSTSCHICHDVADVVAGWRERYAPRGLNIVSIHQPRGPSELDVAAVVADAHDTMHIEQPLAVDNEHTLVDAFANEFVPAYYLFDRNHELVHRQAGDHGFERLEAKIDEVLAAAPAASG